MGTEAVQIEPEGRPASNQLFYIESSQTNIPEGMNR
jgi:hypothetical protein